MIILLEISSKAIVKFNFFPLLRDEYLELFLEVWSYILKHNY
jgi:hypothetical protein